MAGVRSRIYSSRIKDRDWRKNKFTNSHTSKSTLIKKWSLYVLLATASLVPQLSRKSIFIKSIIMYL